MSLYFYLNMGGIDDFLGCQRGRPFTILKVPRRAALEKGKGKATKDHLGVRLERQGLLSQVVTARDTPKDVNPLVEPHILSSRDERSSRVLILRDKPLETSDEDEALKEALARRQPLRKGS